MKISPVAVRRLRTERGWSQEQLAIASGLSLRTVQRVEAEGIASLGTATSLAATYQVKLTELQEGQDPSIGQKPTATPTILIFGLAILTLASIGESGRLPGFPSSDGFAAVNITAAIAGALLVIPSLVRLIQQRQFIGTGLAMLGTPLITLLATGLVFALVTGHIPMWQLGAIGLAGIALVFRTRACEAIGREALQSWAPSETDTLKLLKSYSGSAKVSFSAGNPTARSAAMSRLRLPRAR